MPPRLAATGKVREGMGLGIATTDDPTLRQRDPRQFPVRLGRRNVADRSSGIWRHLWLDLCQRRVLSRGQRNTTREQQPVEAICGATRRRLDIGPVRSMEYHFGSDRKAGIPFIVGHRPHDGDPFAFGRLWQVRG